MDSYNAVILADETRKVVTKGILRKYYRVGRHSRRWYGGIAECHCCGCNMRCVFCWSGFPRDHPEAIGNFYSPEQIFEALTGSAKKHGLMQLRVTGNEPTLGREHLIGLLELVERTEFVFILETNGILIGYDLDYARELSKFRNVHVRVALKGTNCSEFNRLTNADPEGFNLQLKALANLLHAGVSCHPAVMLSFSSMENFKELKSRLREMHPSLAENVEEEYVILYPPVVKRLKAAGIDACRHV